MTGTKISQTCIGQKNGLHRKAVSTSLYITMCLFALFCGTAAFAQVNLIENPGFEDNPPPRFGNNIGAPIDPWILGDGDRPNVVAVDGPGGFNYTNRGPESDADPATGAGVRQHYFDVASGASRFFQSFTVPVCGGTGTTGGSYSYGGSFSSRDNIANTSGIIEIHEGVGLNSAALVPGSTLTAVIPNTPSGSTPWTTVSSTITLEYGVTYSYVVDMGNPVNFDQAFLFLLGANCAPVAENDVRANPVVEPVTINPLLNDIDADGNDTIDPGTVVLTLTGAPSGSVLAPDGKTLTVPGEGVWTVDAAGQITFTPDAALIGDPTPASYQVSDESGLTSNEATVTINYPAPPVPSLELVKSVSSVEDTNGSGIFGDAGDLVNYTFTATNTGNTSLAAISVTDTGLSPITLTADPAFDGDLAAGEGPVTIASATYELTPADLLSRSVSNTATVASTPVATNAGGVPLPGSILTNPLTALPYTPGSVTDTSDAGSGPVISQADGSTPVIGDPAGTGTGADPTLLTLPALPVLDVVKSVASITDANANNLVDAGDTLVYSFVVRNLGNVALSNVSLADPDATLTANGPISLAIGQTDTASFTAEHVITPSDVAAGGFENTATASATAVGGNGQPILVGGVPLTVADVSDSGTSPDVGPAGTPVALANPTTTETPDLAGNTDGLANNDPTVFNLYAPGLSITKSVAQVPDTNGDGLFAGENDEIVYQFIVRNTGNTTISGITVTDPLFAVAGGPITLAPGAVDTTTFTGAYLVQATDITRGFVENSASVDGIATVGGNPINGLDGAPLPVSDTSDAGSDREGANIPGNEAVETPDGANATDGDATNDPTVLNVPANAGPRIDLTKSVTAINDVDGSGTLTAGDIVTYGFRVTNIGNVRLGDVTVSDPRLAPATLGPLTLEVGGVNTSLSGTATITAAEVAQGYLENTASVDANAINSAGDLILNANTLEPLTASDTSDAGTTPDLANNGLPGTITDPGATETPDGAGATNGNAGDDPTVLFLANPGLSVVKSVTNVFDTNGDGLFGGENDEVVFGFVVTNTGNTVLSNVTITDSIATVSGGPLTLAVGASNSTAFTASYLVTPADFARGFVENSAQATATPLNTGGAPLLDLDGAPVVVSKTSDSGTTPDGSAITSPETVESPDGTGATDTDPTNDPTVVAVPASPAPRIDLVKSITGIDDLDGSNTLTEGDRLTYGFTVTNSGNVRLAGVTITDAALVPATLGPLTLEVGAVDSTLTGTALITAADIAAGFSENTAVVTGNAVNSLGAPLIDTLTGLPRTASDTSDAGSSPTIGAGGVPGLVTDPAGTETPAGNGATNGNPTDDPTVLLLPQLAMTVQKSVASVLDTNGDGLFGGIGDEVTFSFVVTNTGTTPLVDVTITDSIATMRGGPVDLAIGASDSATFSATYVVTAADFANGFVENSAEGMGTAADANNVPLLGLDGSPITISDTSDAGTGADGADIPTNPELTETADGAGTTDGDPTNDPTVIQVPVNPAPQIVLVKSVSATADTNADQVLANAGDTVTYQFSVTNTGTAALANVIISDPLLGGAVGTIALLPIDATEVVAGIDYTITADDIARGFIENTATVVGDAVNASGTPLLDQSGAPIRATDVSDTGTDPAANAIGDPAGTEGANGAGVADGDPTNDPTVLNVPLTPSPAAISGTVFLDRDQDGNFAPDTDGTLGGFIVTLVNAAGDVLGTTVSLADGTYAFAGFPVGDGYAVIFGDPDDGSEVGRIDGLDFTTTPVISNQNFGILEDGGTLPGANGQFSLTKVANVDQVIVGQVVTYTMTAQSLTNASFGPAIIRDTLPAGLAYVPGSASLDGVAADATVAGQAISIPVPLLPASGEVVVSLNARVLSTAPLGAMTNRADLFDAATGAALTDTATATIRRRAEAVFECTDIIGKVFDDVNRNGYQDGVGGNRATVTDQNIFEGKLTPAPAPQGEPGIPGVRLVTTDGTIITTDEFGRYSVPCAALPGAIGENFTLKLDTNSLPTGYRVTTENPRTMRVTGGTVTEMNFGASIGQVVDIDLTAAAFGANNAPRAELATGLDGLLAQIQNTPSILRISYFTNGEGNDVAQTRLDELETLIRSKWRNVGNYRLVIERTVTRLQ